MSDNEKPVDIAGIEARLKAITPGGWMYWWVDDEERFRLDLIEGDRFIARKVWDEVDAQFIANAPTDVAALVEELKRLREEKAKLISKFRAEAADQSWREECYHAAEQSWEEAADYLEFGIEEE